MSLYERLFMGPQERAAQAHLDDAQAAGGVATREEAEALSDAVWAARGQDQAVRRSQHRATDDEERER